MRRLVSPLIGCVCLRRDADAEDMRSRLKGLVYEPEDCSSPREAWVQDEYLPDK